MCVCLLCGKILFANLEKKKPRFSESVCLFCNVGPGDRWCLDVVPVYVAQDSVCIPLHPTIHYERVFLKKKNVSTQICTFLLNIEIRLAAPHESFAGVALTCRMKACFKAKKKKVQSFYLGLG